MAEWFDCQCFSDALRVDRDEDARCVNLAIYSSPGRTMLRYRLRHIWRILVAGEPYGDQFCLDLGDVERLVATLRREP